MRYVLIALGAIGDVGRPDFVGVFAERYLSFKSTFERALSARAYFGFFKIAAHCPTPCSCTPASNAAFSASVHLRLPCLCACGLKTTDFANGDNGGVSPGLCALVFVGVVDARHLSFKSTFERAASARPNSGSFKIMLQRPTKSSSARAVRVSHPSPTLAPRLPLALALASSSRPVPVPYFPTPSASASFSSSVQNAFFLRVLFLLFCAFGRPVARVVSHSFAILTRRRPLLGVFRRGPRSFSRTVVCRADTVCMSTSASFRAFIPALTFFFAIARARRRIRAARGVVVVADSRATRDGPPRDGPARVDRRRRFETIDDASIDTKIDRRRVDLFFDDASIDRPTDRPTARTRRGRFDSIRSSIVDATARRVDDVRLRVDRRRRSSERRDLDGRDANGREAMTTTTTTTTRSMGIIGRARATDALARRPRATRERVARRAGGVMVRAMRWRRAREDANAFDGSTRARRARESRMRRFGWTDRTRTRRDERGDAMMGRARAFDETMD